MRLKPWQWAVLVLPIASIVIFILVAAGTKIHEWGLNWIWAVFTLAIFGWRWLLVSWTRSSVVQVETVLGNVSQELKNSIAAATPAGE
jgi:uncharacterized protein